MIKHIFFDLDHTIWDFDRNAEETLTELYAQYQLESLGLRSSR
jgi:putative hydrolase of the HAD superfamily